MNQHARIKKDALFFLFILRLVLRVANRNISHTLCANATKLFYTHYYDIMGFPYYMNSIAEHRMHVLEMRPLLLKIL